MQVVRFNDGNDHVLFILFLYDIQGFSTWGKTFLIPTVLHMLCLWDDADAGGSQEVS